MGQPYGRKRRSSAAWQWLIIGFFPGLMCGGLIVFLLLLTGIFQGFGGEPQIVEVTSPPIVMVMSSTPDPLVSPEVMIITATPEPTSEAAVVLPSPTAVSVIQETPTEVIEPTTEEVQPTTVTDTGATVQDVTAGVSIPAELQSIVTGLVNVPGGVFQMGTDPNEIIQAAQTCVSSHGGACDPDDGTDSTPRVTVELSNFQLEQTEVTFKQYEAFLNWQSSQGLTHTSGCSSFLCIQTQNERADAAAIAWDGANYFVPSSLQNLENHPVYGVTWYGAQAYCQAIGRRLPTEAEWEYAARAGGQNISYPWGNNFSIEFANVRVPAIQEEGQTTATVDSYALGANTLGLLNMAGNVAEWTADWYDQGYYQTLSNQQQASGEPIVNPQGPAGGTQRVLRGGSFNGLPFFARTYHRQSWFPAPDRPEDTYPLWVGFRCAADGDGTTVSQGATGAVDPSALGVTVPSTGDANTNAQPTVEVPPEAQSTESADRG